MSQHLLGTNQRRRLGTHLGLLREDLAKVLQWSGPERNSPAGLRIANLVSRIEQAIGDVQQAFGLADREPPPLRRRVGAVAEVWLARVEDLRARRLASHGAVHPDLAARLDPHVDTLEALLDELARAATELPESSP
ncbi:MAG TPA: hypothetical protein VIW26_08790 [Gemmatimonadales bacterium]|jgi:hypothetical protein